MLEGTIVYGQQVQAFNNGKFKGFIHEGGARSSKTTSIIQFILQWADRQAETKRFVICRLKNTWTTATTLYDFLIIMKAYGIYKTENHNKTLGIIKHKNVEFWFGGLDDPQRLHGFTSDGFWINEANEAAKDDFDQLEMRSSGFFILDYNPRMSEDHWIVRNILRRTDVKYIHSTVIDNPFAPENVVAKIRSYEPTPENMETGTADKNKWEIYGLGLRAKIEGLIYENYSIVKVIPAWVKKRYQCMDLGFTFDPTFIGEVAFYENTLYIDEQCYRTQMLTSDIVRMLKTTNNGLEIVSESADPRLITEIENAGFRITPVVKGAGSVIAGIEKMKTFRIKITERSLNVKKELDNYKYAQDRNGRWLNEPIDDFNHALDAVRYVILMKILGKTGKKNDLKQLAGMFQ